jgi:hypothetical protein
MIAENPTLSHLRLVEAYTAGAASIRRAEDGTRMLSIFLEEGYAHRPQARGLPKVYSQTISGAIFEIIQTEVAAGHVAEMPSRLPQLAYIAIAPFTGPDEAIRLVGAMAAATPGEAPAAGEDAEPGHAAAARAAAAAA